jgi:hypothetical protein
MVERNSSIPGSEIFAVAGQSHAKGVFCSHENHEIAWKHDEILQSSRGDPSIPVRKLFVNYLTAKQARERIIIALWNSPAALLGLSSVSERPRFLHWTREHVIYNVRSGRVTDL